MAMNKRIKELIRELSIIKKKESKWIQKTSNVGELKEKIYEKVPAGLSNTLEKAFEKSFSIVFLKGTGIIEKTFNKNDLILEFKAEDFLVDESESKESIKRIGKTSQKKSRLNKTVTTLSGFGLGALGLGLPDIPLLVSTILKGAYETALNYGFEYESDEEKIYILRLIRTALAADPERLQYNEELDSQDYFNMNINEEIKLTAAVLSDALLVEKFVQGIPVVGIVGGVVNNIVYRKVSKLAVIKYRKRYLIQKINLNIMF